MKPSDNNRDYFDRTNIAIALVSALAALVSIVIGVLIWLGSTVSDLTESNIVASQAIRDETVQRVERSNERLESRVMNELQLIRSEVQGMRSEMNMKLEMQDLKTENKLLKEKQ